jgi:thiol:disulfide interchange protein DsbD
LFPYLLKSLPKSGGLATIVKVLLGFVLLALAFKLLFNADLVRHWWDPKT